MATPLILSEKSGDRNPYEIPGKNFLRKVLDKARSCDRVLLQLQTGMTDSEG
jgi:hypothetical protein